MLRVVCVFSIVIFFVYLIMILTAAFVMERVKAHEPIIEKKTISLQMDVRPQVMFC